MTDIEYLELTKKYPFTINKPYEGQEEDKKAIIEYNKELCEKYPFLLIHNAWTGEEVGDTDEEKYEFTWLDDMPDGWRIAFGVQMCEEIKQALLRAQELHPDGGYDSWKDDTEEKIPYLYGYTINTVKEKFGTLRIYSNGAPEEVYGVIDKYEDMSAHTCIVCGKPAEYESKGWVSPYCKDCAEKASASNGQSLDFYFTTIEEYEKEINE